VATPAEGGEMNRKCSFRLWILVLAIGAALMLPAMGPAKEPMAGNRHKEWGAKLAKELKLSPEVEKKFVTLYDKYEKSRKEIYDQLRKFQDELKGVLSAPKPDEAKVKSLVKNIVGAQNKLLNTFKSQRDEELALLKPVEQGRYLEVLHKWRMEMYKKHEMREEMKGEHPKPEHPKPEMEKKAEPEKK
jgi:Spy/CpxP family protein refolding chaperone